MRGKSSSTVVQGQYIFELYNTKFLSSFLLKCWQFVVDDVEPTKNTLKPAGTIESKSQKRYWGWITKHDTLDSSDNKKGNLPQEREKIFKVENKSLFLCYAIFNALATSTSVCNKKKRKKIVKAEEWAMMCDDKLRLQLPINFQLFIFLLSLGVLFNDPSSPPRWIRLENLGWNCRLTFERYWFY